LHFYFCVLVCIEFMMVCVWRGIGPRCVFAFEATKKMPKKRTANEADADGGTGSSSPPLKRQKIVAASSSSSVSNEDLAARNLQLEQRLQLAEEEIARLHEELTDQAEEKARLHEENQPLREDNQRLHALVGTIRESTRDGMIRYGSRWNGKTTDVDIIDNLTRLSPLAVHYNANVTNQFIRDIPEMLWWQKILQPFLDLKDLSILRRTNTFFQSYWESVLKQNVIRVPQGCPTVEKAMDLAVVFSEKREYTEADPLKIRLDEGVHEIVGDRFGQMNVTCSCITFVGKGNDQTTVHGGFSVINQENVKFEELTVTNSAKFGCGLSFKGSETNVEVLKCVTKECVWGMHVEGGATVTATQCEFMENGESGVFCRDANTNARLNDCTIHHNGSNEEGYGLCAFDHGVVELHGNKTDIHSNKISGISSSCGGKINIHLPSQHNTSHDNEVEDQEWDEGDEGSIANINADGTFTHVAVVEETEDDN
jgi:hypothetical protein